MVRCLAELWERRRDLQALVIGVLKVEIKLTFCRVFFLISDFILTHKSRGMCVLSNFQFYGHQYLTPLWWPP